LSEVNGTIQSMAKDWGNWEIWILSIGDIMLVITRRHSECQSKFCWNDGRSGSNLNDYTTESHERNTCPKEHLKPGTSQKDYE